MTLTATATTERYDPQDAYIGEHYLNEILSIIRLILDRDEVPEKVLWGMAYLSACWQTFEIRHRWDDDAIAVHCDTLQSLLGHGYKEWIRQVFERGPSYSIQDKTTRSLKPRPKYKKALKAMKTHRHTGQLLQFNGKTIEKAKRRRALVLAKKQHKGGIDYAVEKFVPVNKQAMLAGAEALEQWIAHYTDTEQNPAPAMYAEEVSIARDYLKADPLQRNLDKRTVKWLEVRQNQMQNMIAAIGKDGTIQQQYKLPDETGTRYCGVGLSLQNSGRLIRNTALVGGTAHDIEACHHRIVEHFAVANGLPHETISAYVANKKDWRRDLAEYLGIPESLAKVILIATINGWRGRDKEGCDIFDVLKAEGLKRLFSYPAYAGMYDEFRVIRASMLEQAQYSPTKRTTQNFKGHWISDFEIIDNQKELRSKAKKYAFLLQGIEMVALEAALKAHSNAGCQPLIGIHDGWVTATEGTEAITECVVEAMEQATGIRFEVESKTIEVSGWKTP